MLSPATHMTTPRRHTRIWLLSVASAGVLLPGCAKQHDGDSCSAPSDSDEDCNMAVGVVIAPDAAARGSADAGPPVGSVVAPAASSAPEAGPADATIPQIDAQPVDAAAPDVDVDLGCPPFGPGNFNRLEDGACIPLGILLQYDGE